MGVAELLSLLQEFDNPLQHPVIGLVFSAVYNEIKAQKSKKKKKVPKKENKHCVQLLFLLLCHERKKADWFAKKLLRLEQCWQRKVGKLSSLSQAARWASLTGMHTFASETGLHLICCYCLVFACCLMAAQMLE
jgi:hypothetical protein